MLDVQAIFVLCLLWHCHSHQVSDEPTADDSDANLKQTSGGLSKSTVLCVLDIISVGQQNAWSSFSTCGIENSVDYCIRYQGYLVITYVVMVNCNNIL